MRFSSVLLGEMLCFCSVFMIELAPEKLVFFFCFFLLCFHHWGHWGFCFFFLDGSLLGLYFGKYWVLIESLFSHSWVLNLIGSSVKGPNIIII